jgi:hypothetical protein
MEYSKLSFFILPATDVAIRIVCLFVCPVCCYCQQLFVLVNFSQILVLHKYENSEQMSFAISTNEGLSHNWWIAKRLHPMPFVRKPQIAFQIACIAISSGQLCFMDM